MVVESATAPALPGWEALLRRGGSVERCASQLVEARGLPADLALGTLCRIATAPGMAPLLAEIVALDGAAIRLAAYGQTLGLRRGARVWPERNGHGLRPDRRWRGRVLDAFGTPLDDGPPPPAGPRVYPLDGSPVPAHRRRPLGPRLELGLRALDLFTPCRRGQRLGLFAGTGVGKSTALAMAARRSGADALVVALIGERGRELLEFVRDTLGPDGLARSVVVAATSDQPPLVRRRAAHAALAIAEALRDDGLDVLLLFDSVTRYAMALREIHLAAGEPPTARGYPPSVFAALPRLLERAGTGAGPGSITALFSVLVEGDDTEEPIADAVRGILDGHVVFDRRLAERGLYPAIDVLRSLSRSAPGCYAPEEAALVLEARRVLALAGEMAELVQLGAYKAGTDPAVDRALRLRPLLERLIAQAPDEPSPTGAADGWAALRALLADGTAAAPGGPADGT